METGEIPKSCDVVVIGGGPAGSSVSALLAKAGVHVVLLEKVKHPRPNVGESLIPHFWKFADTTGVSALLEQEGFLSKAGGITVWEGKIHQFSFSKFGYTRPALHVERDRFDHLLIQHAHSVGTEVFEQVTAKSVDFSDPERIVVYYKNANDHSQSQKSIACRYVVDASGTSTLLAKQFNSRRLVGGKKQFLGMWGYFENANYISEDGRSYTPDNLSEIKPVTFVISYEHGWAWHIILRKNTSVGLVINTERTRHMGKKEQEAYFLKKCFEIPYLRELLAPARYIDGSLAFRPDYSYYSEKLCGENFCCIGDAGTFVDPIFSHGVQAAFFNAAVCAYTIQATFRNPKYSEMYSKLLKSRLEQYYGFSRSLALGDFDTEGVNPELVQGLMKSMSTIELEMMLVASDISNRSSNFLQMARDAGVAGNFEDGFVSDRASILEQLYV